MEKCCIICGSTAPVLTNSGRISAFRQASNQDQRCDDLAERLADDATTFWCHKNCISTYCSPDPIQRLLKRMKESDSDNPDSSGSSSKHLRSSTEGMFNFCEYCLLCGEECQVIPPQKNPMTMTATLKLCQALVAK